jgi:hypothetical protein
MDEERQRRARVLLGRKPPCLPESLAIVGDPSNMRSHVVAAENGEFG